jgi:hypothetical protein
MHSRIAIIPLTVFKSLRPRSLIIQSTFHPTQVSYLHPYPSLFILHYITMVRTRTVLLKPAHASRREIFSHQFARHHARDPRPSIIQFPSAEATAAEYRLRSAKSDFDFSASDVFTYSPPERETGAPV